MSSEFFSVLSRCSCKKAAVIPRHIPTTSAIDKSSTIRGRANFFGGYAGSTTRMFVAFRLLETPVSLSFDNSPTYSCLLVSASRFKMLY